MKKSFSLPFRQIHLDFHTAASINDVGRDFDAQAFARTMKKAHVNSVTVFAKCHHGLLYYNTRRPERHPGLKPGLNLLGEQIEALHREGIRAPIYISVLCDEYAAQQHPDWVARDVEGKQVGRRPLDSNWWYTLDMSSPYQEYLAGQVDEVLRAFKPVDGIFFDMCWDQPSVSTFALAGMLRAKLDPEKDEDRQRYAHQVALAYLRRFHQRVKAANPAATVYFNCRHYHDLAEEGRYLAQVEIESLPTGGWGYMYFPKNVRYARIFGLPYLGMTARFHKSWADFGGLKPYAALEYETSQMLAHGARCSIGDQLHPRGKLEAAAYELIGRAYQRVEEREKWVAGAQPVVQIGLFQTSVATPGLAVQATDEGAVRMLTQLRQQFDVVTAAVKWDRYSLLILPDGIKLDAKLAQKLRAYLRRGGKVLATGTSGLNADGTQALLPELSVKARGFSPYTATYFRPQGAAAVDLPLTEHVMYERGVRVTSLGRARSLAQVVEPYFERSWRHFCSHRQTPPGRRTRYSAAVCTKNTVYVPYPIFSAFAKHGNYPYRLLIRNLIGLLLPEPLLQVDGPTGLEATVMRQRRRTIVHLLYYAPERRAANLDLVEDIVPLFNVRVSLKLPAAPKSVKVVPGGAPLKFFCENKRVAVNVPEVRGHQMIVFE